VYSRINTLHRMTTNTMQQLLIGGSKHFNVGRPRPPRWPLFLRPCRYNCSSCVLRQVTSESVAVHSFNCTHHYQFTLHIANMTTSSVHRYDLQVSNDLGTNVRSVYVRLGQSVACLPGRLWVRKKVIWFLADRTNGRACVQCCASVCLSVVFCLWRYVLWLNGAS